MNGEDKREREEEIDPMTGEVTSRSHGRLSLVVQPPLKIQYTCTTGYSSPPSCQVSELGMGGTQPGYPDLDIHVPH